MRKAILFMLGLLLIVIPSLAQNESQSVRRKLGYEIGLNGYVNKGFQSQTGRANYRLGDMGLAPYIFVNYDLKDKSLPLNIGFKMTYFKTDVDVVADWIEMSLLWLHGHGDYLNFQMPLLYTWQLPKSDFKLGLVPSVYLNTFYDYEYQINEASGFYNWDIEHNYPGSFFTNIDLMFSYSYFFKKVGNHDLGFSVFADYSLFRSLSYSTRMEAQFSNPALYLNYVSNTTQYYTPFFVGAGLTIR